uniref:DM2 domain-containing protein n=1 Tax=Clytia hemisphaerica TaxID=252671 RepID=A0A7M5U1M3_9CNID
MNTWRVYLSFSLKGTQKLFHILSEVDEPKLSNAAIVFPPSFLLNGSNSSDTWHCCYTWNKNFQHDTLQEMTNTFKHLNKDNSECNNHEDDVEFITDCVHQLANEIPSTGISLLEIYVFLGDEVYNDDLHMDLFLALKRLELWNNALMMLIEEDGNDGSTRSWTDLFNFEVITHEMFHKHHTLTPLWGGAVTLLMEKRSSHLPIGKWYLQATQESTKDGKDRKDEFFKNILGKRLTNGIAFGNNIEIAACVQQEDLPYHLMYPVKYTLHSLNEKTGFDFFKFCSKIKGCWCMAFLRYDFSKQTITPERTREEWMQHIQESLSHYLCVDYSWSRLRHHCVMFVRYSELNNQDKTSTESSCILDVYFLRHRPFFNANGYLELLKKCDDGLENSLADEKLEASNQYTSQAVELIHPSEWCEKQAWYLRENASNVGK